ncbi:MAG: DUF4102 domain-containing protein [Alphaproteobacteria bacterium]|nr:DUF4102 domain-containing protein [Alphaproteobacteria bacterium]
MSRTGKLSAIEVAKAKGPVVLHDGGGLYLRVSQSGTKAWVFRFQLEGRRRDMGLGPYRSLRRADGRDRTPEAVPRRKIDPLGAKATERQAQRLAVAKGRTFRECAAEFIERNRAAWRNAKHRQRRTSIRRWGNWPCRLSTPSLSCRYSSHKALFRHCGCCLSICRSWGRVA